MLICLLIALVQVQGRARAVLIVPMTVPGGVRVGGDGSSSEPSITRQILIGAILIVMMAARPQGCSGRRVERSDGGCSGLRRVAVRCPCDGRRDGGASGSAPRCSSSTGVSLAFGGLRALDELDLHVAEREIVSVIGPNGAGKTTVFNVITGVYDPTGGDVRFAGRAHRRQARRTGSRGSGSRARSRACACS